LPISHSSLIKMRKLSSTVISHGKLSSEMTFENVHQSDCEVFPGVVRYVPS